MRHITPGVAPPSRNRHDAADSVVKAAGDGSRDTRHQIPSRTRGQQSSAITASYARSSWFPPSPSSDCVSSKRTSSSPLVPCLIFSWNTGFSVNLMVFGFSASMVCSQSVVRVCSVRPAWFLGEEMTGLSEQSRNLRFSRKVCARSFGPLGSSHVLMLSCSFFKSCQKDRCTAVRSDL